MNGNPFSEPDDDRTVIRPVPGGRRGVPPAAPPADPAMPARQTVVAPAARATEEDATRAVPISVTPLAAAAAPLLQLLARLRNTLHQPDAGDLRERVVRELHDFERRAREGGIAMDQLRPAHFALCATIDDVVLNTPWGAASNWASQSLLASFHPGARSPDPLSDLVRQLRRNADKLRPASELVYLCISLGFTGRSAPSQGGAMFDRPREETYTLVATQPDHVALPLSPRWEGIAAPYRSSRGGLPVWVVATLALAACGGLFVWVSTGLNAASDDLQAEVLAAPPGHMPQVTRAAIVQPLPPAPPPPERTLIDQLDSTLKPEIDRGQVSVLGTAATPILRIPSRYVFATNSASVLPAALPLLQQVAASLKDLPGSMQIIGYTDNQPVRMVQFPSNFQLSAARAQSVRAIVARTIGDAGRVSAEGRADADAIAPNATPEGREQNRRIEIVLSRQD